MNKAEFKDTEREYQSDLQISKFKLEEAALDQPVKMAKWGSRLAKASARVATVEHDLATLKAEKRVKLKAMDSALLKVKFGFDSMTDTVATSVIERDGEVKAKSKELIQARFRESVYKSAEKGASQRSTMIRVLTDQYIAQYWSNQTERGTKVAKK